MRSGCCQLFDSALEMSEMFSSDVLDFGERDHGGKAASQGFGTRKSLAIGHEAGAHRHHGLLFVAIAATVDGEAAVSHDEVPAFGNGYGWKLAAGFEIVFCLAEDAGVLHGCTTDHDT